MGGALPLEGALMALQQQNLANSMMREMQKLQLADQIEQKEHLHQMWAMVRKSEMTIRKIHEKTRLEQFKLNKNLAQQWIGSL